MPSDSPALRMLGIGKRFGRVTALSGVDFEVAPGEIHALLGENGAGKSTLMKILYGLLQPDSGEMEIDGKPVRFDGPRQARAAGIGMVHQHLMLVESLTVAENLALDASPSWLYRRRAEEARALETAARLGLALEPGRLVRELSLGERQRVEIVKALVSGARLLVLDEPTTVLTPSETEELFGSLRDLAGKGRSIVFISHDLSDVLGLCHRVTVLRHGASQGTMAASATDASDLARRMIGRDVSGLEPGAIPAPASSAPVLEAEALRVDSPYRESPAEGVAFRVSPGEILGIAGIEGNGQLELCSALAGLLPALSGKLRLRGADITAASPLERAGHGLGFVPADRTRDGIVPSMSLEENLALKAHRRPELSGGPFIRLNAWRARAGRLLEEHGVRPPEPGLLAGSLSGGNQQKLLMARELDERPVALVAANPTRGLDVGATQALHRRLLEARAAGMAILLVSADLDEILSLSDRVLVAFRGRLYPAPRDRHSIGLLMGGEGVGIAVA